MEKNETAENVYEMLSESGYSEKAIRFYQAQENIGIIEDADHITALTGPCGDTMKISFNVEGEAIKDARIQVLGCPGAVASGCAVVNLAKGKTLEEARRMDLEMLYKEVEKLPDQKIHCARLALKTLHKALDEYFEKTGDHTKRESGGTGT
jgi:nitrogen fixation NifU-like protein